MAELGHRSLKAIKYSYLVGFFALLAGVFNPIVTDSSPFDTIAGIIILFIGLLGGILIYRGAISQKSVGPLLITGLILVATSLGLIFSLIA